MNIELGIGAGTQTVAIPDRNLLKILLPNPVEHSLTGEAEVLRALSAPIGAPRLREVVRPGEKIAIVTSDITRPCPSWLILPAVLDELYAAGADRRDITVVFGLGQPPSPHRGGTAASGRRPGLLRGGLRRQRSG